MKYLQWTIIIIYLLVNIGYAQNSPGVVINEFMAANSSTIADPDFSQNADWIELYNNGNSFIDLNGYYLTDDLSKPDKWKINIGTVLAPKSFTIFWADGNDTLNHTNFSMSKDGEQIGLFFPNGQPADTLNYLIQKADISYGRYPDGGMNWYYMYSPTPGKQNDTLISKEILSPPVFSLNAGFYSGTQYLTLTHADPLVKIYYTTNGSEPDEFSTQYTSPIVITKNAIVRAASFKNDSYASKIITCSYFINENITLPVVSLATDSANFFDNKIGIYVEGTNGVSGYCVSEKRNWNQDWERPVHMELFEKDKALGFSLDLGVKIGGGCTRKYDQKSLAIYARSVYGESKINYKIFPDKPIDKFNNINLRNSGQDWYRTLLRDGLTQSIVKDKMDIDWEAYKPAVLFLDGGYMGIYGIREKHNEHYLAENHDVNADSVDLLVNKMEVKNGSAQNYSALINYIGKNDLALPKNYEYVKNQVDIDEYINYQILEIFFANIDWPGGNIKYWRPQRPGGKWRWIMFDMDLGFGAHNLGQYNSNSLAYATSETQDYYANPTWSTLLFRNLLKNEEFKNKFIQRFAYHMNTTFEVKRVQHFIDSIKTLIATEIPRHKARWEKTLSFGASWEAQLNTLYEFANKRAAYIRSFMYNKFGISGSALLTINNKSRNGDIKLCNNVVESDSSSFILFKDIPVKLIAVPKPGFKFVRWEGISSSTDDTISVLLNANSDISPVFEKDTQTSVGKGNNITGFYLLQNYPNPFNPDTRIEFSLPGESRVTIKVYNVLGEELITLLNENISAGTHEVMFSAQQKLTSGIYYYRIKAVDQSGKTFIDTKKMLLLK